MYILNSRLSQEIQMQQIIKSKEERDRDQLVVEDNFSHQVEWKNHKTRNLSMSTED